MRNQKLFFSLSLLHTHADRERHSHTHAAKLGVEEFLASKPKIEICHIDVHAKYSKANALRNESKLKLWQVNVAFFFIYLYLISYTFKNYVLTGVYN